MGTHTVAIHRVSKVLCWSSLSGSIQTIHSFGQPRYRPMDVANSPGRCSTQGCASDLQSCNHSQCWAGGGKRGLETRNILPNVTQRFKSGMAALRDMHHLHCASLRPAHYQRDVSCRYLAWTSTEDGWICAVARLSFAIHGVLCRLFVLNTFESY